MIETLSLANLFQRRLIPIGKDDKAALEDIYTRSSPYRFTHWLIALMWCEEAAAGWAVLVFPVSETRVFWQVPPLFHTLLPSSFDKAWRLSKALQASSENDQLTQHYVHPYWDNWEAI